MAFQTASSGLLSVVCVAAKNCDIISPIFVRQLSGKPRNTLSRICGLQQSGTAFDII
jgi:hypothetical protein